MTKPPKDERDDQETARRRDEALRRALKMPPKPHKPVEQEKDDDNGDRG